MPTATNNDPLRQLAVSTEESAVRERFDAHNASYGRLLSIPLLLAGVPMAIAHIVSPAGVLKTAGALMLLGVAVVLYLLCSGRSPAIRRAAGVNLSLWIIALVVIAIQLFGLVVTSHRDPADMSALAALGVWLIVFFWTAFARRVLAHAVLMLTLIVAAETAPARNGLDRGGTYAPAVVSSVVALFIGGWVSRRARRATVADWMERHAQAVEQLRMRDELALARQVQLSMLPAAPPSLPWLDIAASSTPATEVGGDYYDYFQFGHQIAIVCGDVAGHGFASGIVLAALRSGFTLLRDSLGDPARVLIRLHELIEQTSRTRMLATAAVVSIDPASRRARIASAGHPPVMLRSNGSVRAIELFGPPLGVRLPISIAQTEIHLTPGDVFVLHSDGVYETTNAAGELYGLDRLAAIIERTAAATAAELRDAIVADLDAFRGSQPQTDDVTLVVARLSDQAATEAIT